MPIQFDSIKKHILLPPGTEFTAQEIYNAVMDWADEQEAMDDDPPMLSTGYAPLGGGAYTDKIFILSNGWKLKPASGTYQLTIKGTIVTDDETSKIVLPDYGNVEVVFLVSSQATVVGGEAGVWSEAEKDTAISKTDEIKAKTENLPPDPASTSDIQAINIALSANDEEIKTKTQNLPPDPASQSSINQALEAAVEEIKESVEQSTKQQTVKSKAIFPL